jgi:cytochrome c5
MSDRTFIRFFSYMIGTMVILTVVVFVIAQVVAGSGTNAAAVAKMKEMKMNSTAIAERMKPVGRVLVRATKGTINSIIPTANAAGASGKGTYDTACVACHGAGVAGAPKVGDKANWKARIAQGNKVLYGRAIKGYAGKKGFMPPKGGNTSLSDAAVKAAVDYMVKGSK